MKKLKNRRGETLVETLVSILVIVLTFLFLTTAAMTAAKINAKVQGIDVSFRYSQASAKSRPTLKLTGEKGAQGQTSVQLYEENGYLYYTAPEEAP